MHLRKLLLSIDLLVLMCARVSDESFALRISDQITGPSCSETSPFTAAVLLCNTF